MTTPAEYQLTDEQKAHFLANGYIRLSDCFSRAKADHWTRNLWTRLGMSPNDKTTWTRERINMPFHTAEDVRTFAPKAWSAICQLLGGEERIASSGNDHPVARENGKPNDRQLWTDGLIVNLGTPEGEGKTVDAKDLRGWHVDGDFFVHYLDSPEQGLLVIPLFSDIQPNGGGTMICPDGIGKIAKHLYDHPEGVSPRYTPRAENPTFEQRDGLTFFTDTVQTCSQFVEASGSVGDVYLLHPLMLHSASNNSLRIPRVITNPPVSLKEPFNFDRDDPNEFSLVEQKTLKDLGRERLSGWKITGGRDHLVPMRLKLQAKMKEDELRRLNEIKERDMRQEIAA